MVWRGHGAIQRKLLGERNGVWLSKPNMHDKVDWKGCEMISVALK